MLSYSAWNLKKYSPSPELKTSADEHTDKMISEIICRLKDLIKAKFNSDAFGYPYRKKFNLAEAELKVMIRYI